MLDQNCGPFWKLWDLRGGEKKHPSHLSCSLALRYIRSYQPGNQATLAPHPPGCGPLRSNITTVLYHNSSQYCFFLVPQAEFIFNISVHQDSILKCLNFIMHYVWMKSCRCSICKYCTSSQAVTEKWAITDPCQNMETYFGSILILKNEKVRYFQNSLLSYLPPFIHMNCVKI